MAIQKSNSHFTEKMVCPELIFDSLLVRLGGKRSRGRILKEILRNRLSLTWGSVNGSYCSNVEQVGLT
jgi:hypothetical protein